MIAVVSFRLEADAGVEQYVSSYFMQLLYWQAADAFPIIQLGSIVLHLLFLVLWLLVINKY